MKSKILTILAACFLAGPITANANLILQTNSSWRVTPTAQSGTDWYTNAAFNDSGWQSAAVLYDVGDFPGYGAYTGAKGIWSSGGQYSVSETSVWIRQTFNLAGPLSLASLIVGCDDDCTVWVNGIQVINDTNGSATNNSVSDLTPYLNVGTNLIAYTATDNFPVYGYNHSTWLQLDGELQSVTIPEPSTVALFGLGLLGLGFARRRD